jgi:hypothetical protein
MKGERRWASEQQRSTNRSVALVVLFAILAPLAGIGIAYMIDAMVTVAVTLSRSP